MTGSMALRALREAIVLEHLEAENERDFATTIAAFDRTRYEIAATGEVYEGRAEVSAYYSRSLRAWPDLRSEVVRVHHADDAAIVELEVAGTEPGTGRACRARTTAFFEFDGPSLVGKRLYGDEPS
ncbi:MULTISPECIES: nuclear transport factor 2 family protein [Actinosynnema]|uniref:SnoaL-like domain-containing protein n=1 Tax=Actinosynnema pretiosum TaxID=42197 RepID=A0A290Z194_9PSEU|nr:nuclear transport factor 2 family protein [Actinosynnema pretiosum]ATE52762.1 hypothetical protein CNX65_05245 [Actinosynnema pretiosum]MCP2092841.1 SnoaL-like domain-containing protein [Actinosynnema pretiosum]